MTDMQELKRLLLDETRSGGALLNSKDTDFITTIPQRLQGAGLFSHPLADRLPPSSFVPDDASVASLSNYDVLSAFELTGAFSRMPRFLLAGPRRECRLNPCHLRAAVLTAGGNAPGLNTIIDSIVKRQFLLGTEAARQSGVKLTAEGYPPDLEVYGIIGGYKGLESVMGVDPGEWLIPLQPRITDAWSMQGCSNLKALRTATRTAGSAELKEYIAFLVHNVRKLKLDILYAIGGNGTLMLAQHLSSELKSGEDRCIVVGGPKTMDNDVNFTDVTFGFRTTVDNSVQFLRNFHREAETLNRIGVIELFGAGSGFVALHAAYASGDADYVLIPENMGPTVTDAARELAAAVRRINERASKRGHALFVVAEGASIASQRAIELGVATGVGSSLQIEAFQHGHKSQQQDAFQVLVRYIKEQTGKEVFHLQPKHLVRATPPNSFDIDLCRYTGKLTVDSALAGFTGCAVHLWQGNYVLVPLETAAAKLKYVDTDGYYFRTLWERYLLS
jgi:6-phosphofructokinase 1